jgi:hypothetical protein
MGFEKRKSPRSVVRVTAMMANMDGTLLSLCKTLDMSATGARLEPKRQVEVPDEFLLVLSRDARIVRHCKAVWRADGQIGVRFLADEVSKRVREISLQQPYRGGVGR